MNGEVFTVRTTEARDATAADLERAGYVTGEMLAEHVRIVWAASKDAISRAEKAERALAALRDQVAAGGCEAAHLGERTYECDIAQPCGLCRLRARSEKAERLHSEAEAQIACRNELRAQLATAERERDTLRAELAALRAPVEGEPTDNDLRDVWDAGAYKGLRSAGGARRALWRAGERAGVAHERARHARSTDAVYRERDILAALAAKLAQRLGYPAWTAEHDLAADPTWEPEWRDIVFFRLPTGQCSWHLKVGEKAECGLNSLPVAVEPWDGHTTEEKYARILAFLSTAEARPETKGRATDEELFAIADAVYDERGVEDNDAPHLIAARVAARVRQERCLIAQAVAANADIRVAEDDAGFMVGVHAPGCDEELRRNVPAAEVPATLARLAGLEVSRG